MTVMEIIERYVAAGGDPGRTIAEIVRDELRLLEYDGLASFECGCGVDDLFPCGCLTGDCQAGYRDGNVYRPGWKKDEPS